MPSPAADPQAYLDSLPQERQAPMAKLRQVLRKNLPKGFAETMSYGMIGYVVPHSLYPAGYHCDPKLPLPFLSIASQKNFVAVYHMGLYADPGLMAWFTGEYENARLGKAAPGLPALDLGKSCIRFKKPDLIPFGLLGELAGKTTVQAWIALYEKTFKR